MSAFRSCSRSIQSFVCVAVIAVACLFANSLTAVSQELVGLDGDWERFDTEHFGIIFQSDLEALASKAALHAEQAYDYWTGLYSDDAEYKIYLVISDRNDTASAYSQVLPQNVIWVDHPFGDAQLLPRGNLESLLQFLITQEVGRMLDQIRVEGFMVDLHLLFGKVILPSVLKPMIFREGFVALDRLDPAYLKLVARARSSQGSLPGVAELSAEHSRGMWPSSRLQAAALGALFLEDLRMERGTEILTEVKRNFAAFPLPASTVGALQMASGTSLRENYDDFVEQFEENLSSLPGFDSGMSETPGEVIPLSDEFESLNHTAWSPDGSLLIYHVENPGRASGLRRVRWDGLQDAFLLSCECTSAHWVNQSTIVYTKLVDGNDGIKSSDLYSYRLFNNTEEQITFDEHVQDVTPMGVGSERILFVRHYRGGSSDLLAFNTITRTREILHRFAPGEEPLDIAASRDGSRIAITHFDEANGMHVKILDDYGDALKHYGLQGAKMLSPRFSFDGRYLIFVSNLDEHFEAYGLRISDGRLFKISNSFAGTIDAKPSPDGEYLALVQAGPNGYGLMRTPFRPDSWSPTSAQVQSLSIDGDDRQNGSSGADTSNDRLVAEPYDPVTTLFPTFRLPFLGPWNVGIYTQNNDPLGQISYQAAFGIGVSPLEFFYDLTIEHNGVKPNLLLNLNGSPAYHRQNFALRLPISLNEHRSRAVEVGINRTLEQTEVYTLGDIEDVSTYDLLERRSAVSTRAAYAWTVAGLAQRLEVDWTEMFQFPLLSLKGPHSFVVHASAAWSNLAEYRLGGGLSGDRPLRGHDEVDRGAQRVSLNLTYEFPLMELEISCCQQHPLPLFFNDIRGSLYLDSGVIGSELNIGDIRLGFGSEVRLRVILGYGLLEGWLRMGLAYGFENDIPQLYFGFDQGF